MKVGKFKEEKKRERSREKKISQWHGKKRKASEFNLKH